MATGENLDSETRGSTALTIYSRRYRTAEYVQLIGLAAVFLGAVLALISTIAEGVALASLIIGFGGVGMLIVSILFAINAESWRKIGNQHYSQTNS